MLRRSSTFSLGCRLLAAAAAALPCLRSQDVEARPSAASVPCEVTRPKGVEPGDWAPMALVWLDADADAGDPDAGNSDAGNSDGRALVAALAANGWLVACLDRPAVPDALGGLLAKLRQTHRIQHGALHAVAIAHQASAMAAVDAQAHEFQSLTICGGKALDLAPPPFARLPHRSFAAIPGRQPEVVRARLAKLRAGRLLPGGAAAVDRALDSFHDAAATADQDRYFRLLPDDAVFLGTDGTERWTGAEFRAFALPYFQGKTAWTYVPLKRHVQIAPGGDVAWFDEVLDNQSYGECRGSGVLVMREKRWVLAQYNLTVPVPNDLTREVATRIRRLQRGDSSEDRGGK
ncbi:MAG: nuclear transport factor 2 family protein [Planctomycetota bacterium]